MSASAAAIKERPFTHRASRPVMSAPSLSVVPSPAPRRGFMVTVFLCIALFVGALILAFYLNTRMVQGAYEITEIKTELAAVQMQEEALESKTLATTSPEGLEKKAKEIGMVPAGVLRNVNIEDGSITVHSAEKDS